MRRNFLKQNKGFSFIEVVMAAGIGLVVLAFMANYMADTIGQHRQLTTQQSLSAEATNLFRTLDIKLGNAFRLLPNEDLYAPGDGLYQGLNEIVPPTGCLPSHPVSGQAYPAMRWSTISSRYSAETLLRPFKEAMPQKSMDDAARLSFKKEAGRLFQSGHKPPEVTIFDVDGWLVRRYRVPASAQKNTLFSPYDDKTPVVPAVEYTQAQMMMPKNASGGVQGATSAKFLSGSTVYSTRTHTLCVGPANKIMIVDESTGKTREFMNIRADNFELKALEISYEANLSGGVIDPKVSKAFPATTDEAKCIEAIRFTIVLENVASKVGEERVLTHITGVPNFSSRQPSSCM